MTTITRSIRSPTAILSSAPSNQHYTTGLHDTLSTALLEAHSIPNIEKVLSQSLAAEGAGGPVFARVTWSDGFAEDVGADEAGAEDGTTQSRSASCASVSVPFSARACVEAPPPISRAASGGCLAGPAAWL